MYRFSSGFSSLVSYSIGNYPIIYISCAWRSAHVLSLSRHHYAIPYGSRGQGTRLKFSCFSSTVKLPVFEKYIGFMVDYNIPKSLCHSLAPLSPSAMLSGSRMFSTGVGSFRSSHSPKNATTPLTWWSSTPKSPAYFVAELSLRTMGIFFYDSANNTVLVSPSIYCRNNSIYPSLSHCSISSQLSYGAILRSSYISPSLWQLPMVEIKVVTLLLYNSSGDLPTLKIPFMSYHDSPSLGILSSIPWFLVPISLTDASCA